ncbi:glycosyltransferase [Xanthomonas cannabis]|uniref:glycosyltransferase n=1 Tax=Xanthomonas cannabis TaxID=1885674 RepID=UPI00141A707E|nr:glycosyltransferase [Xanthomonas cannabis]NIK01845.1 glycosyltransferase involved in cell wall biosynthesis [Xanthomonas cannabis]NIK64625.1 glycosyltransferase involved in cell wall biosynthesis [Xanthomonas cannabis]
MTGRDIAQDIIASTLRQPDGVRAQARAFPMMRVISRDNGVGLTRDMVLMAQTLRAGGVPVQELGFTSQRLQDTGREARLWASRALFGRVPLQIFSERVYARCLALGQINLLVPNPEWLLPKWLPLLPRFDAVLCKTHHAERIFQNLGCTTRFIGFTSPDRYDPQVPRQRAFFHLAGRSTAKGTRVLLETWKQHPEWPLLTVVQNPRTAGKPVVAPNIDHRVRYLDDAELRRLQNAHLFHLCPSEAEGFGHYLMEALSVGAVTLATDGEPMNELVRPEHGVLIPAAEVRQRRLASYYYVDAVGIAQAVDAALAMPQVQLDALSANARAFYQANDAAFAARFRNAVLASLPGHVADDAVGVESVGVEAVVVER